MRTPYQKPTSRAFAHRRILNSMKPGEKVILDTEADRDGFKNVARKLQVKITTRKLDGVGFGVWRV